jgi:prohibitin 2
MELEVRNRFGGAARITRLIGALLVALIAVSFVSCGMQTVETGHRGIKTTFGKVVSEPLTEGLYFFNPFTSKITELDTRTLTWGGETEAYTRDVQEAKVKFVLNYNLRPDKSAVVFQTVGRDWPAALVSQVVLAAVKETLGQWDAVKLIANRREAGAQAERAITLALAEKYVVVSRFEITDLEYSETFNNAIEAKVIAQQKAIEEQNRTVQIQEQANQKVVAAKANAEATVLNAKAEAESISIRARALEQNQKLVDWEAVQKWNGQLPTYMLGGSVPFVNLPAK